MARQMVLRLPKWGGRRNGAGRPRTRKHPGLIGPGVPHLTRPDLSPRHPIHVTLRVQPGVGHLRAYRRARLLERAFANARERFGMRVVHYAILGNHLHLIVEADGAEALSRGMQALAIRVAKGLNAVDGRRGGVFTDRYHAHVLRSRRETTHAVRYVLNNHQRHTGARGDDLLSSARFLRQRPGDDAPVAQPRTWLLRVGWSLAP